MCIARTQRRSATVPVAAIGLPPVAALRVQDFVHFVTLCGSSDLLCDLCVLCGFPHFLIGACFGLRISALSQVGERQGLGNDKPCGARVTLTRGYARFMRGYARLSAVKRANARFELFRVLLC